MRKFIAFSWVFHVQPRLQKKELYTISRVSISVSFAISFISKKKKKFSEESEICWWWKSILELISFETHLFLLRLRLIISIKRAFHFSAHGFCKNEVTNLTWLGFNSNSNWSIQPKCILLILAKCNIHIGNLQHWKVDEKKFLSILVILNLFSYS